MTHIKKQPESDEPPGAPEWMVTFSDCMTLLLTFFVLLLSFSSFDDKVFRKMETALAQALPSVGVPIARDREAFLRLEQIVYKKELDDGSEKSTLNGNIEANPKEETQLLDFQNRKVFLISSNKIFWGKGTFISLNGREILSAMALFLKTIPNRIIISENAGESSTDPDEIGLQRAWTVLEFLTTKQDLDKSRFSISAASTMPKQNFQNPNDIRILEIVILERGTYN